MEGLRSQNLLPNPGFEDYLECPLFSEGLQLISQWQTNQLGSVNNSTDWRGRDFIHACDADVEPWWNDQLGEGVLGNLSRYDPLSGTLQTVLIWTDLISTLEQDSLYYIEYTTAPTLIYYVPEQVFLEALCVPPNLGVSLKGAEFTGTVDLLDPMVPDFPADLGGIGRKASGTTQIGHCFLADGSEQYLLYGLFQQDTSSDTPICINGASDTRFLGNWFIADNIKLEKVKLEVCCDTIVCQGQEIDFSYETDYYVLPNKKIVWNDGVEGAQRTFTDSDRYRYTMITECGSVTSNWINVEVEACPVEVYVPNAFTPNGDAVNPFLSPRFSDGIEITEIRFSIFNRWGQLVHQTISLHALGWDGTVGGLQCDQDTYIWHLEFGHLWDGETVFQVAAGAVTLLR